MPSSILKNFKTSPKKKQPKVSIIIPTLNSAKVIANCLQSISNQSYKNIEIIIVDGGSTDNTISIAKNYKSKIILNKLVTAESAKAIGLKKSTGKFIALIDSDNILPEANWLVNMLLPFNDPQVIGAEPWSYTYRKKGGFIERYSALTGVNDPYALIANNYDRKNYLRSNWNGLNIKVIDYPKYQTFTLIRGKKIPSIGANGTLYNREAISQYFHSDYLIDVDLLNTLVNQINQLKFAKVKCGIIHTYCESSIIKFINKQNRRVVDLYNFQSLRPRLLISSQLSQNIVFGLYVILIFPMVIDTFRGFFKKPDVAWFFHPFACIITLYVYGINTLKYKIGILKPLNRKSWQQ